MSHQRLGINMVAHRMIKNLDELEIEYVFIVLIFNTENIKQLLYIWGTDIFPHGN